ncbi:MAG: hypothetical protein M1827_001981 [Pycnora praestabilis]|nr:MAG: hypothetical protein M1827_001981 [Pycnora praestabilis]
MAKPFGIQRLSNELLREILDHIDADPDKSINIDRRAYLSVESFKPPSPPVPAQAQDVAHFRLVCQRFAELGISHQFTRVTTRWSRKGFERLDRLSRDTRIAQQVKKFSYMVPCFYVEGRERVGEFLYGLQDDFHALDAGHFVRRAKDQKEIIQSKEDVRILKKAISAFKALQHVQILRLQDESDRYLLDYIRENQDSAAQLVELKWTPACIHATKTVGEALFEARSPFTRFSGPMMNPQCALALKEEPTRTVSSLAERLTCLELHFDDGFDLNRKMMELSGLFGTVFQAAKGMQAVHLGFPSHVPLDIKLETIFHGVKWDKLRAFGIQAWRLDAEEITALARRHRRTLRGLRLRDVLLKDGSLWKDVLGMLLKEMDQLDWVSLRRIGYSKTFDDLWAGSMEVTHDLVGGASDSDEEDEFPTQISNGGSEDDVHSNAQSNEYDDDSAHSNDDDNNDYGPEANELALGPDTPSSVSWCNCDRSMNPKSEDDWGDNGRNVDYTQRKIWEKWVIGRCPFHSSN